MVKVCWRFQDLKGSLRGWSALLIMKGILERKALSRAEGAKVQLSNECKNSELECEGCE